MVVTDGRGGGGWNGILSLFVFVCSRGRIDPGCAGSAWIEIAGWYGARLAADKEHFGYSLEVGCVRSI